MHGGKERSYLAADTLWVEWLTESGIGSESNPTVQCLVIRWSPTLLFEGFCTIGTVDYLLGLSKFVDNVTSHIKNARDELYTVSRAVEKTESLLHIVQMVGNCG